ncbi:dihydrolipoamide acetyltransferase family protein [Lysinimonas soli]|uniref:Dihydrolipoamide acetyltransferase component of pyruvate dehydrogenase complex n=1 Tax=Lysinimonas soli TaxID=1074233 RepID=A0ABW0NLL2_9MICO
MSKQFLLPDLGEGLTEAEVVTWLVAPGDVIEIDQLVVEVESAKSVVELPSPYGGRVERLDAAQGDVVAKGSPLLTISSIDAALGIPPTASGPTSEHEPSPELADLVPGTALREEAPSSGSGAVLVGYGTREPSVRLKRPAGGRFGARTASDPASSARDGLLDLTRRSPVVSPLVRRLARSNGFDASHLLGSGPGSLVRRDDVESAIAALATPTAAETAPALAHELLGAHDIRIPLTGMRKLIASRLSESRRIVPEATIWLDVDATELFSAKERLQNSTGERFSLTSLIARFTVAGLKQFPVLNSSLDDASNEIVQHGAINLGIAAQTPRGLMVPVIHNAHELTTRELRDQVATLVAASEKGEYAPSALSGGTFTLNNYGGFGVDGSTPIINFPEVAMLGIGRIIDRPWVLNGQIVPRKVVTLSFVFDHRVCDGGIASGFLSYVARCIEEPLLLLGNL